MGVFSRLGFASKKKEVPEQQAPADSSVPPSDLKAAPPSKADIVSLTSTSVLTKNELTRLSQRFERLSDSQTGLLDVSKLYSCPEFACCLGMVQLCVENVIKKTRSAVEGGDQDHGKEKKSMVKQNTFKRKVTMQLTFGQFVKVFSILSPRTPRMEKVKFLFDALDDAEDGFLGTDDMFKFYLTAFGSVVSHELLREMATKAIEAAGLYNKKLDERVIHFERFESLADQLSLKMNLTAFY